MTGSVTSMVVAPPAHIGPNGENHRTIRGASKRVISSRKTFAMSVMVPNSAAACNPIWASLSDETKIDDKE